MLKRISHAFNRPKVEKDLGQTIDADFVPPVVSPTPAAVNLLSTKPRIVRRILRYCNQGTLSSFLRVSRNAHALALPILYSEVEFDLRNVRLTTTGFESPESSLPDSSSSSEFPIRGVRMIQIPLNFPALELNVDCLAEHTAILTIGEHTAAAAYYSRKAHLLRAVLPPPLKRLAPYQLAPSSACLGRDDLIQLGKLLSVPKLDVLRLVRSEGHFGPAAGCWGGMSKPGCPLIKALRGFPAKVVFKGVTGYPCLPDPYGYRWAVDVGYIGTSDDWLTRGQQIPRQDLKSSVASRRGRSQTTVREYVYVCSAPDQRPALFGYSGNGNPWINSLWGPSLEKKRSMDTQLGGITYILWNPRPNAPWEAARTEIDVYYPLFDWFVDELRRILGAGTKHINIVGLETLSVAWARSSALTNGREHPDPAIDDEWSSSPKLKDYEDRDAETESGGGMDDGTGEFTIRVSMVDWMRDLLKWMDSIDRHDPHGPKEINWDKTDFISLDEYMRSPAARDAFTVEEIEEYFDD
ncbi:hypothetical protein IAT40_004739 [Kwoniella sp. CBS 6097]